jgi:hypothetical protein
MKKAWSLSLLALFFLAGCGPAEPDLNISDIWGRPSPQSATNAAFYMTIQNTGRQPDRLIGAKIDACAMTELHETAIDKNDVMSMQHVEEISLPAGETVKLEVGGLHIMCMNRQVELNAGDKIPITLSFAVSGERVVKAEIREN